MRGRYGMTNEGALRNDRALRKIDSSAALRDDKAGAVRNDKQRWSVNECLEAVDSRPSRGRVGMRAR
jgi:hypothetical protein